MIAGEMEEKDSKRPQVLLFGNGLVRAFGGKSWEDLLSSISFNYENVDLTAMPETLQALLVTSDTLKDRLKEKHKEWYGTCDPNEQCSLYREILTTGFTEILTTNYGYELEIAATEKSSISEASVKRLMSHNDDRDCKRAEGPYMLHTFNNVSYQGIKNRIWHIHGEARKPTSIMLDLYTYGTYIHRINALSESRENRYKWDQDSGINTPILSWVDAFIMGDVYVLGFGYGFSEADLWWLLKRKSQENAETGTVYFYEPKFKDNEAKYHLLKVLKVEIDHLGTEKRKYEGAEDSKNNDDSPIYKLYKDEKEITYQAFYEEALAEIKKNVESNRVSKKSETQ